MTMISRREFIALFGCAAVSGAMSWDDAIGQSGTHSGAWYTRGHDNSRQNWTQNETTITPQSIATNGLSIKAIVPVSGDRIGQEAQVLILPQIPTASRGTRDVVLCPSLANIIRCVDAYDGSDVWDTPALGTPINSNLSIDMHGTNQHVGILSTPVYDPDTYELTVVCWQSIDGTPQKALHYVYVLDVRTGKQVCAPVLVTGTSLGQQYNSQMRKQRASLTLATIQGVKTVFWASGTIAETSEGAAGWIFAFDCSTHTIAACLALTTGEGAGVWMGGQGLAVDAEGYLYGVTGNGSYDGVQDFGECGITLQYVPKPASLTVVSAWSPYLDLRRSGKMAAHRGMQTNTLVNKIAGESAPTEEMKTPVGGSMSMPLAMTKTVTRGRYGEAITLYKPAMAQGAWADEDLGSAGGVLIEELGLYLFGGKDGVLYARKIHTKDTSIVADLTENSVANCNKLAFAPVFATFYPGAGVSACPQNPLALNIFPGSGNPPVPKTRHMHSTPAVYKVDGFGWVLFVGGENSPVQAWHVTSTGITYLANSDDFASPQSTAQPGGMTGSMLTISSNGTKAGSGLLYVTQPFGDANATTTRGRLLILNPDPSTYQTRPDGSKRIPLLWRSDDWKNWQFNFVKFTPVSVGLGRVYMPTADGRMFILG